MNDTFKEKAIEILKFFTNRLFILAAVLTVSFGVLVVNLFERQIVYGDYSPPQVWTFERVRPYNAPRGEIFDVNGRPLAVNIPVFVVMLDPTEVFTVAAAHDSLDLNQAFLLFMEIMARNDEEMHIDAEFIISDTVPRVFTVTSESTQRRWKYDLLINVDYDAPQAYEALMAKFQIPSHLNREDAHTLLMLRSALYLQRWNVAQVGLAVDISRQTVAALEEFGHALPGLYVAYDYLRYYPQGRYMTNIVGYLARISPANLETYGHLGYTATDLFGAMGAERAFEHELRGTRGETTLELDNNRRRVGVVGHTAPIAGQDIFLTVDSVLQRNIYYIIEGHLADILLTRLRAQGLVFAREVLDSILRSNNINSLLIMNTEDAEEFPASYAVRNFVLTNGDIDSNVDATRFRTNLNNFIGDNILSGHISTTTMFDIMAEQGIIEFAPYESAQLRAGQLSASAFLIRLVENRQLTPQIINIDPATASVAISCVHTGGIIAAVNYPTFDGNNFLPHRRDNAYINHLNVDRSNPQFPRAFMETQPPGSTFKMVTALAGLSQGVITPQTRIFDRVVFRDAGWPYLSCMGSHGSINVVDAIAVSCNYFFNRVAFNLGGRRTQEGMAALNYYMRALGLGEPTGVEISEARMFMPSPQWRIDDGRAGNWTDGNTIQLSIGQGYADFTVLSMAKVMATLATGGTRMQMHLLNRMVDANGNVTPHVPVIEYQLPIDTLHVEAIHRGMREVVTRGTGANIFRNFPMEVAVKSGTAEVSGIRMSHSSYGGFAPYRDPQIAIYTIVPHGDTPHLRGSSGHVTRDVLAEFFGLNNTAPEDDSNGFIR